MRILLADDHALFRDGLASLLSAWGHEIVGQASDGVEAVAAVQRLHPDLVLMDVRMPGSSGLDAARLLGVQQPDVAIVMLTVSEDETDLFEAIRAGARGYLLKSLDGAQLRAMLAAVERGEVAITPATAARIIALWAHPGEPATTRSGDPASRPNPTTVPSAGAGAGPDRLTARELEVLQLVTSGLRNKEIAARLGITENTAKYHLRHILEKLHAETRTEIATRAMRDGLIEP